MPVNIIQQLNTQKWLVLLPKISSILLVIITASAMAELLWVLIDSGEPSIKASAPTVSIAANQSNASSKIAISNKIALTNLYGKVDLTAPKRQQVEALPDTDLDLKLNGILSTGGEDGLAIISSNNNEEMYKVGSSVPGNAILKQVLPDRVILESRRGLETLRLPIEKLDGITVSSPSRDEPPSRERSKNEQSRSVGSKLQDYRKQFIRNPASISEFADVKPVQGKDGKFQGYALSPKSEQGLFKDIGLEAGDIITGVNGIELDQPAKGLSALRKLMNAKQLDLTVMRDGVPISIQREFNR